MRKGAHMIRVVKAAGQRAWRWNTVGRSSSDSDRGRRLALFAGLVVSQKSDRRMGAERSFYL